MIVLVLSSITLIAGALISVLQLWFPETKKTKKILSFIFLISVIFGVVTLVVDKNEKDEIEDTIKSTPKKIDTLKTIVDEQTNSLSLSLQKNQILLDSLSELDGKTRKILKLNKDLVNQFEDVNSSLQNQIALGKNLGKELEKQKYKLPEKLFLRLEFKFKISKDFDYTEYLKIFNDIPPSMEVDPSFFDSENPKSPYKELQKVLGALQIMGNSLNNTTYFFFDYIDQIQMVRNKKFNYENPVESYLTKNENLTTQCRVFYEFSTKEYYIIIYKFPIHYQKSSKITSVLDLQDLDFQLYLNVMPNSIKDGHPYLKIINKSAIKIYLNSETSNIGELKDIDFVKVNGVNSNIIKGKMKINRN